MNSEDSTGVSWMSMKNFISHNWQWLLITMDKLVWLARHRLCYLNPIITVCISSFSCHLWVTGAAYMLFSHIHRHTLSWTIFLKCYASLRQQNVSSVGQRNKVDLWNFHYSDLSYSLLIISSPYSLSTKKMCVWLHCSNQSSVSASDQSIMRL